MQQSNTIDNLKSTSLDDSSLEAFIRDAATLLRLELTEETSGACHLKRVLNEDNKSDDQHKPLDIAFRWIGASHLDGIEVADATSKAINTICEELKSLGPVTHVRPKEEPTAVHDVSNILFSAYQIEKGAVHLVGCHLEDVPFLRISFVDTATNLVFHEYFAQDGRKVQTCDVHELGMDKVISAGAFPPRIGSEQVELLLNEAERQLDSNDLTKKKLASAIVWAKVATGKLEFSIDDAQAELPFSGWAKTLVAPAYHCEASGMETFQLAKTDDERIVASKAIAACEISGKRILKKELVTCNITGKHVLEEYTKLCPVVSKTALKEEFSTCSVCEQEVSNAALKDGVCLACKKMESVSGDDARIVWLLGEHPAMDKFRKWSMSETSNVYIVQARTFWKRLLFVVDKETMNIYRMAKRSAISSKWITLEPIERDEFLGKS